MKKKARFILLSSLVILFFLIAPAAIFYSQGYRFDFDGKKIVRTGGFYFKVQPRGAQIYLNDKFIKGTDFLFKKALIDNLLPRKYKVEIKKEGYFSWGKTLEVEGRWVTEGKNIFLVLRNPEFILKGDEIKDFFFSPDMGKIALEKKGEGFFNLLNLERNTETSFLLEEGEINKKIELSDFQWTNDSKKFLLKSNFNERSRYFIFELNKEKFIPLDFLGGGVNQISFDPRNSQKIFFVKNSVKQNSLFSADYLRKEISGPVLENIITYEISNGNLFWLDTKGNLSLSDFTGKRIDILNADPLSILSESQYKLIPISQKKIFVKEGDNLYFFNQEKQTLEKISDKVKKIKISPDLKKVVYFTDYEIWVLFLKEAAGQPQRKEGERLFLTRFSEEIGDVFWWTSHYLVFNTGNSIKIAEIDDRDKINIYNIAEFENPKIFWNQNDKRLYILSQGNLYSSQKLY